METGSFELKPQKTTLHTRRSLLVKLLITAIYTAAVLTAGLYGLKKRFETAPAKSARTGQRPSRPAALPAPEPAVFYTPAVPGAAPGSVALVKAGKSPVEGPRESRRSRGRAAEKPVLRPVTFGGSGGNFAPLYAAPAMEEEPHPEPSAEVSEGEIVLEPSDLRKKIKVKGSKPLSKALSKRYSGIDIEAEALREQRRAKAAADEAARKRRFRGKLGFAGLLLLWGLALMLLGSRIIRALRLLKHPEGPHWTLKK